ncbi:MAG TPA: phosphoribosylamine--glycine ligase [Spirochaetota bacterium]|nr:phosphoribosylamine--glycine ligase [Spirochaetota bacterium]
MKYLVIGSGGREHAIAWRLINDGSASEVFVAPGNGGIHPSYRVAIQPDDFNGLYKFCIDKKIDMVIVGPEVPLVNGIADFFHEKKIPCFGPSQKAAMIEGSKLFAKHIMEKYNVPTAGHWDFTGTIQINDFVKKQKSFPLVIKLDGLAAGKGVIVAQNRDEALEFIDENVKPDSKVFAEEFLDGEEASVLGISDGFTVLPLIAAQDHKRVFDGDKGPNTGGMGAYAPAPVVTPERLKYIKEKVLQPVIDGMRKDGIPFKGILYAGVMIGKDWIKVLEFNARFGDPETQVILPLLDVKLGDLLDAAVNEKLSSFDLRFKKSHAITVVVAAGGYPGSYAKGKMISGLEKISEPVIVFHAGTDTVSGNTVTNGGRVLNVTSTGSNLMEARNHVYACIGNIAFEGSFFRQDIGYRALTGQN